MGLRLPAASSAADLPSPTTRESLTLNEAVRLGVERNLRLLEERLTKRRREYLSDAAYEFVAPKLSLGARRTSTTPDDRLPPRDAAEAYDASVDWTAPAGTTLSAGARVDRAVAGDPRADHTGSLSFSIKQPLLKGGWAAGSSYALRLAELARETQRELFVGELERLLVDLHRAYWELALAEADLGIKIRSKERAAQRFEDTRENIRLGILASVEIFVVEENLVFFTQQELSAEEKLQASRRKLADLLVLDPRSPLKTADSLDEAAGALPETESAVALALERNPGLKAQALRWEQAKVQWAHERNRRLPSLDLSAAYKANGQAGTTDGLWAEVGGVKRPESTVGLTFSIPLWRSPDRARALGAELEAERSGVELERSRRSIDIQVRDLATGLGASARRLALSMRAVELGEKKLEAEGEKYKAGNSTLADVVRFQRELDLSLIGVQQERFKLIDTRNRLLQVQGTFHEFNGVSVRE